MDLGDAGYGAGGGLLSAVFSYLGFRERLNRTDKDVSDLKADIEKDLMVLKASVVYKDTCGVCHDASQRAMDKMDQKLDLIIDKLGR